MKEQNFKQSHVIEHDAPSEFVRHSRGKENSAKE
jgi:hypothetical protein